MIDILVVFRHLASNTTTAGFLTETPQPITLDEAKAVVDELQIHVGAGHVEHISLFTRNSALMFNVHEAKDSHPQEVTIPEELIKGSILSIQIIEVDAA